MIGNAEFSSPLKHVKEEVCRNLASGIGTKRTFDGSGNWDYLIVTKKPKQSRMSRNRLVEWM